MKILMKNLTAKEFELVNLVLAGMNNAELASDMGITKAEVKNNLLNIYDKLDVHNRLQLTIKIVQWNYNIKD